ncbi:MAG: dual specificity protein phosphatase family protein [bacterium]|nr:dual specificity protein phosphatase family protein [bacterium]
MRANSKPPNSWSYWVKPQHFLAGAYPGAADVATHEQKLQSLLDAGIRVFLNLMEPDETNHEGKQFRSYEEDVAVLQPEAECVRFAIQDANIPQKQEMVDILDAIDGSHAAGRSVYVHCWGGIGRTGTVVACWLLRHRLATADNVFEVLKDLRRHDQERGMRRSPETDLQWDFVRGWHETE